MKISRFLSFALACACAASVFADAANTLISFSTKAPSGSYPGDTYADGKTVLDGEWYALVWSPDGAFGGITIAGEPARAGDRVILMAPLAKGGCCPYVVFQLDSASADAKTTGRYAVYLLDTRSADGSKVAAKGANGRPVLMNGSKEASVYAAAAATAGGAQQTSGSGTVAWGETAVGADVPAPVIKAFEIAGDRAKITVEGLVPGVKYNVKMGKSVEKLDTYGLAVPQTAENAQFNIDKKDAQFFQVVREPLTK